MVEGFDLLYRFVKNRHKSFAVIGMIVEGKLIHVSDECARIHGFSVDEFLSKFNTRSSGTELVHPDDCERFMAVLDEAAQQINAFDHEYLIVRPDGEVRHVRETGS